MVVRVRLGGLKIARARGKYYVYRRSTGERLITGFEGSRAELQEKLEDPGFIQTYNRPRLRKRAAIDFAPRRLGGFVPLVHLRRDRRNPRKARSTAIQSGGSYLKPRAKTTLAAYDYLRDEFDMVLRDIKQPDLYATRDTCANKKWPRFADKMISALSSMFEQAVKRGKMDFNPCLGMDKIHEADPNVESGMARAGMEICSRERAA